MSSANEQKDHDGYSEIADRYERFYEEDPKIVAFFKALVEKNEVRRVLDCACGTGRELLIFHSLGCEATGSDISPSMLALARKHLAEAEVEIPLHQADFRELHGLFSARFDAVLVWSGAIFHVTDDNDALRAFDSMRKVLEPDGILVMDQGMTDRRLREKRRFVLNRSTSEASRVYVIDFLGERDWKYNTLDITHDGGKHKMDVWSTNVHFLLEEDQERLLGEAGFSTVEFYGTYDFEPYDRASSLRLFTVAHNS